MNDGTETKEPIQSEARGRTRCTRIPDRGNTILPGGSRDGSLSRSVHQPQSPTAVEPVTVERNIMTRSAPTAGSSLPDRLRVANVLAAAALGLVWLCSPASSQQPPAEKGGAPAAGQPPSATPPAAAPAAPSPPVGTAPAAPMPGSTAPSAPESKGAPPVPPSQGRGSGTPAPVSEKPAEQPAVATPTVPVPSGPTPPPTPAAGQK